ncbi:hypothetical protein B0H63DRAFT_518148 [Podospora didyma]|uniref:Uncharacterized protein n=1 Tax=Podospora didyma TaxID=330526 RepID=A0AAE0U8M6_9PEZI|nr:hypothetical protein B0H63DRAFT_518148 [Podospora didyma]
MAVLATVSDEATNFSLALCHAYPFCPEIYFWFELALWAVDSDTANSSPFPADGQDQTLEMESWPIVEGIPHVDGFFAALFHPALQQQQHDFDLNMTQMTPEQALHNNTRLLRGIVGLYRRYTSQVANREMRTTALPSSPSSSSGIDGTQTHTIQGAWSNARRAIVKQALTSKIIIQVLLGIMCASGVGAYYILRWGCGRGGGDKGSSGTNVFLRNPCSIAGTASLLAGSVMGRCNDVDGVATGTASGREDKGQEEEKEENVAAWAEKRLKSWESCVFTLGRWGDRGLASILHHLRLPLLLPLLKTWLPVMLLLGQKIGPTRRHHTAGSG